MAPRAVRRNHFGCIRPIRRALHSQHSAATASGSVMTRLVAPLPVRTVESTCRTGRSMTTPISRLVAARSRIVFAFAILLPLSRMHQTRLLPWGNSRNASRSSSNLVTTASLRAGSGPTGRSCTPGLARSRRVFSACYVAPARTCPITRRMRTCIYRRGVLGLLGKPVPPPGRS